MYLYLARRDKTSVRLLMVFMGEPKSGRVDVTSLGLPSDYLGPIEQEVYANRMLWEPWVEPAVSFQQLKDKLAQRGYTDLPMSSNPVVKQIKGQTANLSQLPPARKSMLQKKV